MTGSVDFEEQQRLHQQIAHALVAAAPAGWSELRSVHREVGRTAEQQHVAVMADGQEVGLRGVPKEARKGYRALRELLYQPDKGTWYTATCTVTSDGRLSFDFDYDAEPKWSVPVVPGTYVEDLEMFPRAEAARPNWLRSKLAEAGSE